MGQYWEIFNLTHGKVMPIHDGSKYCEKCISIDVLLYLLQKEWKGCEIVMIGDYDDTEKCAQFTKRFLDVYELTSPYIQNLYLLNSEDKLPVGAYRSNFASTYGSRNFDPHIALYQSWISSIEHKKEGSKRNIYFIDLTHYNFDPSCVVSWKPIPTSDVYMLISHTSKEYVRFDSAFFEGFYDAYHKTPLTMTIVKYNSILQNVVKGLITHNSEYCETIPWHGRWAGHALDFMIYKEEDIDGTYTNISHLFEKKSDLYDEYGRVIYSLDPEEDL